jgi:uncharacterized membrane protein YfcA
LRESELKVDDDQNLSRMDKVMDFDLNILILLCFATFILSFLGSSVGIFFGQLRQPILMSVLSSAAVSSGTNLAISSLASLSATTRYAMDKRIDYRLLFILGGPSALAAFFASKMIFSIDPNIIKCGVGAILVYSSFELFKSSYRSKDITDIRPNKRLRIFREAMIGAGIGIISGIVGFMMNSLRLPTLMKIMDNDIKKAIGTNVAIGCLTGLVATISLWHSGFLNLKLICILTPATVLGSYLGARSSSVLSPEILQRLMSAALAVSGCSMIFKIFA